ARCGVAGCTGAWRRPWCGVAGCMVALRRPLRRRLVPAALLLTALAAAELAAQPQPAARRTTTTTTTVTVVAGSEVDRLPGDRLAAGVAWLLGEWYGPAVAGRAAPGGDTAGGARPGATRLLLALTEGDRGLHLRSELVEQGRSVGVRNSWLPAGSLGAVTATAAGDGFLLWSEARRFPHLHRLGAPPDRSAWLPAAGLAGILRRPVTGRDVQAAAAYPGGVLVLLADGPLALGPRFEIVPDTAAWLTWREEPPAAGAPWRNLYPLHDGRVVLEPWSGTPVVTAAWQAARRETGPTTRFAAPREDTAPAAALLAVAADGTAAWHGSGTLTMLGYGAARPDGVRLPLGSVAPSATAADGGGVLWTFDPRERRIRAFAATGGGLRQVLAVTPMLPAEELGGVQAIAVTAGGRFLIGSQRAVWNVDRRGMPRWALRLLQTQPRQRLPQAFTLAAGAEHGAFVLLDRTTGSVHRFAEQPEPAADRAPATGTDPRPGAMAAALADSAMHAAERAWQQRHPESAALLLAAAARHLKRWHAADPLADGVERRSVTIEQLGETVEHALYGAPPLTPRIAPGRFHPALAAFYETHPFTLTLGNAARDREPMEIALGIAGTTSAITVAAPALAVGEQVELPVQLHAAPGAGRTALPYDTTLWLAAAAHAGGAPVLSAIPFAVEPRRCRPEQALATPAGPAHAAFLRWHLTAAATAPAPAAPVGLPSYRLVDRLARLADVAAGAGCLQTADHTLAALSGAATDWAVAVAGMLHQRGTPAALLLSEAAPVLVLAWFEHHGEAVDPAAPRLAFELQQEVAAHLEEAGQAVPPGPVWALLPVAGAASAGGGAAAWSTRGDEAAAAALAAGRAHVLTVRGDPDRGPSTLPQTPAVQAVLPLADADGENG
ncbi:MAG: hypothetical protein OXP69_01235, partial [Spirochaetaceae bacterium]|nr:hypothetical protein [Spirochaetaceae bacterium]